MEVFPFKVFLSKLENMQVLRWCRWRIILNITWNTSKTKFSCSHLPQISVSQPGLAANEDISITQLEESVLSDRIPGQREGSATERWARARRLPGELKQRVRSSSRGPWGPESLLSTSSKLRMEAGRLAGGRQMQSHRDTAGATNLTLTPRYTPV